jgi:hypothetical protein
MTKMIQKKKFETIYLFLLFFNKFIYNWEKTEQKLVWFEAKGFCFYYLSRTLQCSKLLLEDELILIYEMSARRHFSRTSALFEDERRRSECFHLHECAAYVLFVVYILWIEWRLSMRLPNLKKSKHYLFLRSEAGEEIQFYQSLEGICTPEGISSGSGKEMWWFWEVQEWKMR